jgi:hypothetical protein
MMIKMALALLPGLNNDRIDTYVVKTPYYTTVAGIPIEDHPVADCEKNYKEYDIFKCRIWLMAFVDKMLKDKPDVSFESRLIDGKMILTVNLYTNGRPVTISKTLGKMLETEVQRIHEQPYVPLIDCLKDIYFDGSFLPSWWLMSVARYITIDDAIPITFMNGKLCIDLSSDTDYFNTYSALLTRAMRFLTDCYSRGIIFYPGKNTVYDLALIKASLSSNGMSLNGDKLYMPSWNDSRICGDRVSFIRNYTTRDEIKINTKADPIDKYQIASIAPEDARMIFGSKNIYIPNGDHRYLSVMCSIIESAILATTGGIAVTTVPVSSTRLLYSKKDDINPIDTSDWTMPRKILRLGDNSVLYPTVSYYAPYTQSQAIDINELSTATVY